jgi:hypothetical protein
MRGSAVSTGVCLVAMLVTVSLSAFCQFTTNSSSRFTYPAAPNSPPGAVCYNVGEKPMAACFDGADI